MEFILIIAFILGYSSLSSKITRIASALPIKNKKRFSSVQGSIYGYAPVVPLSQFWER